MYNDMFKLSGKAVTTHYFIIRFFRNNIFRGTRGPSEGERTTFLMMKPLPE
jgi:hypothetical protein